MFRFTDRSGFSKLTQVCCVALLLISTADVFSQEPDGNTWLQWRGPTRDGKFYGPEWPEGVSAEHLEEKWRVNLDKSYSGPIVTEKYVITTETRDRKKEIVYCFDRETGAEVWQHEWQGAMKVPFFAAANGSWIRSTPGTDGQTLFVGGIRDVLVAIDIPTGKEKWRIDFKEKFDTKLPSFGMVCSPLIEGDHVYVQAGASFVKLNKSDGTVVWRSAGDGGGMYGSAFSSPIFTRLGDSPVLLVQTRQALKMIDDADGSEICSRDIEAFRGMNILTPTIVGDSIFTSAHSGKGEMLKIASDGNGFSLDQDWENKKLEAYMSSPVVIGDHGYLFLKSQRFCCFNLETGEAAWRSGGKFGKYWSMVTSGDRILALDERGDLLMIKANAEKLEVMDQRKIGDNTWAHLAPAGKELFVRELESLVAYRWK